MDTYHYNSKKYGVRTMIWVVNTPTDSRDTFWYPRPRARAATGVRACRRVPRAQVRAPEPRRGVAGDRFCVVHPVVLLCGPSRRLWSSRRALHLLNSCGSACADSQVLRVKSKSADVSVPRLAGFSLIILQILITLVFSRRKAPPNFKLSGRK